MDSTDIQYEILMQCNLSQFIFWSGLNRKFYKWRNNTQLWEKKFTRCDNVVQLLRLRYYLPFTMRGYRMYDKIWTKVFSFFRQFDQVQPVSIRGFTLLDGFHTWLEDDRNFNPDLIKCKITYESMTSDNPWVSALSANYGGLTLVVTYGVGELYGTQLIETVFIATISEILTILYKYYYFEHISVGSFQDKWKNNGDRFRWERNYISPDLF